jgi:type I restriction enzyme, S subunit
MNSKWPMVPLGEVLAQYKEYIESPEPKIYPKLSVKLYGKGVILDSPTDGTTLKMKRHQIAKSGQVILSEIWGKKGAIGFVPPEGEGALCTSHFFLFDVDSCRIDQKYLRAIFIANYLQNQLDAEAKGTTGYAAVRPKILFDARIPLPPLDEQRRIVARIEELAARIEEARELRRQAMEEANALTKASLVSIFEGKINIGEFVPRPLPQIAEIARGKFSHRPRNEPRFYGGDVPFIQIGDISNSDRYIVHYSQTLNQEGLAISRMFQKGTVVIAITGATIGATGILTFDSCFPDSIVGIIAKEDIVRPEFIYWGLEYAKKSALAEATQTTQPNINLKNLEKLQIPIPSLSQQNKIVMYLDALQSKLDALKRHQTETAAELDALLPTVLERSFRGEL